MNAERIQLFALIGLRALAEYDPFEFRRCTELSKRQIEDKIQELIQFCNDDEARKRFEDFKTIETQLESAGELSFLLKQIHSSSLQKAQQLSLAFIRTVDRKKDYKSFAQEYIKEEERESPTVSEHEDLLRLGVMLLLRKIKGYTPLFSYRWKDQKIDCLLEPLEGDLPFIIIESKILLRSYEQIKMSVAQISKYMKFWGKKTLGIIMTKSISPKIKFPLNDISKNIFLLIYDSENNEFVDYDLERLLTAIHAS